MAIRAKSLIADRSYTIFLSSTYDTTDYTRLDAYGQLTIQMNAPPHGGVLSALPSTGLALNTTFTFETYSWTDDPDDFPLEYTMKSYSDPLRKKTFKTANAITYASVLLGQGPIENAYQVTAEVAAADIYGAKGSATTTVIVNPIVDKAALASAADASLKSAFANSDPVAVSNVINAVSASLTVINCTTPYTCSTLSRDNCIDTPKTCGECLDGFIGAVGDANSACVTPSTAKKIGEACM